MFYSTLNDETLTIVADKLGIPDWKSIAEMKENISRYGKVRSNVKFKPGTLLRIPKNHSKWKIQSLHNTAKENMKKLETCEVCHTKERPNDTNDPPMLLCDGCDAACHVGCAGLLQVPDGDWFCNSCLDILQARRDNQTNPRYEPGTLRATLPPLSKLAPEQVIELSALKEELRQFWRAKQKYVVEAIKDNYQALQQSMPGRKAQLKYEILAAKQEVVYPEAHLKQAKRVARDRLGLVEFSEKDDDMGWIRAKLRGGGSEIFRRYHTGRHIWDDLCERRRRAMNDTEVLRWSREYEQKSNQLSELKASLSELEREERDNTKSCEMELRKVKVEYASLLGQSQLSFEKQTAVQRREFVPRHLGSITVDFNEDVVALNMLREPEELIIAVPRDFNHSVASLDQLPALQLGETYAIFAREALFDKKRDDEMPIDVNGLRDAQRRLFHMLTRNEEDKKMIIVSEPQIPPSVKLRGDENTDASRFFGELVRDCNCDLELPKDPTPLLMSANGHELRDYQQSSLRWCPDKERETTGLGTAGELWHRARFLDPDAKTGDYFFCELTGSFALDIFDFQNDADQ